LDSIRELLFFACFVVTIVLFLIDRSAAILGDPVDRPTNCSDEDMPPIIEKEKIG
jgi:hypothetical protein